MVRGGGGRRRRGAQCQADVLPPCSPCSRTHSAPLVPGWCQREGQPGRQKTKSWRRSRDSGCGAWVGPRQLARLVLATFILRGDPGVWAAPPSHVKLEEGQSSWERERAKQSGPQRRALQELPSGIVEPPGQPASTGSLQNVPGTGVQGVGRVNASTRLDAPSRGANGTRSTGAHGSQALSKQDTGSVGKPVELDGSSTGLLQAIGRGIAAVPIGLSHASPQGGSAEPKHPAQGSPEDGVQASARLQPQRPATAEVNVEVKGGKGGVTEQSSKGKDEESQRGGAQGMGGMGANEEEQKNGDAGAQGQETQEASKLHSAGPPGPRTASSRHRFLVAICFAGRLTNQLYCMRNYVILARLLGWTLLVPTYGIAHTGKVLAYTFHWANVVDWTHMASCLQSPKHSARFRFPPVMTFEEYIKVSGKSKVVVDRYVCGNSKVQFHRMVCVGGHSFRNFEAHLALHKDVLAVPHLPDVKPHPRFGMEMPTTSVIELLKEEAKSNASVFTLGDLFEFADWFPSVPHRAQPICKDLQEYEAVAIRRRLMPNEDPADVCPYWTLPLLVPGNYESLKDGAEEMGALPPCCQLIWQPQLLVRQLVMAIQKDFFSFRYAAVHLRREDFYLAVKQYFKLAARPKVDNPNFTPIADVAREIERRIAHDNISSIFLATNARRYEIHLFKSLLQSDPDKPIKVLTLKDISEDKDWIQNNPIYGQVKRIETFKGGASVVLATVDKYLCVGATKFFGNKFSTFTYDVRLMRQEQPLSGLFA